MVDSLCEQQDLTRSQFFRRCIIQYIKKEAVEDERAEYWRSDEQINRFSYIADFKLKKFREFIEQQGRLNHETIKAKQLVQEQFDHEIQPEQCGDYNLAGVALRRSMSASEKFDLMSDCARYIPNVDEADAMVTAFWINPAV